MEEAEDKEILLDSPPKYFAAIQITRPKSASKTGTFVSDSSINQSFKVAKLVLKPVQSKAAVKSNQPKSPSTTLLSVQPAILSEKNKIDNKDTVKELKKKKELHQHGIELERLKSPRVEKEKNKTLKTLQQQNIQQQPVHSPSQHKSKMDENARREAREFMKKQREKRKMEVKKDVDKSFVIKQRLEELRQSTKNAVMRKTPSKSKSPVNKLVSPMKDSNYYSMENNKMKEIKFLRLKPISKSAEINSKEDCIESPIKLESVVKKSIPASRKPSTPTTKKLEEPPKLSKAPLQVQNTHQISKPKLSHSISSKENRKPLIDDLKLNVPDLKLNLTSNISKTLIDTDIMSKTNINNYSVTTIPYFLQNIHQPYPHNFIWAVRKKLEAFVQQQQQQKPAIYRSYPQGSYETPQLKKSRRTTKGRKIAHDLIPEVDDDDGSETNAKSQELHSEANTISEISSIQTDMAKSKSQSQEKAEIDNNDDDTTISESVFQSLSEDPFIGKKCESVNSEFDRASFNKKFQSDIVPRNISPNTSEKRNNFLSSTKASEDIFKIPQAQPQKNQTNDLNQANSVKSIDEKEEDFRKMLLAFNKSLSHVVEVNHMLSSALVSKSTSIASSKKSDEGSAFVKINSSASKQEYSSSFEKNIDTNNEDEQRVSETNSSIQTLIENSEDTTLKPETSVDHTIEDPPLIYHHAQVQELTSSTTNKAEKNSEQNDNVEHHQADDNNTLNESRLINLFKLATDAEVSFNTSTATLIESNGTLSTSHTAAAFVFNKSSSEIKSWEKSLIERTRGQIAWLELQKQHFKRHGQSDKVSTIKRQQRAILIRLDKERMRLRENSEKSLIKASKENLIDQTKKQLELSIDGNGSDTRENIERILKQREQKIEIRRKKIEHLLKWQNRLDDEERILKKMENELLNLNTNKMSHSPIKNKKIDDDILNTSLEMVKSIDKSLKVLENIEISHEDETVDVRGEKMNKLWFRLTGIKEEKFMNDETYHLTKKNLGKFYEEAKELVLESDLKLLLETSMVKNSKIFDEKEPQSDVDTMNSIANIETEEEYPGSYKPEFSEAVTTSTENDDELQQIMANQMKVFVSSPLLPVPEKEDAAEPQKLTTFNDQTFQVQDKSEVGKLQGEFTASPLLPHVEMMMVNKQDESTSTIADVEDMDVVNEEEENSSLICTESIDLSSVDKNGFIIPEEMNLRSLQITDMDDDENIEEGQMIEDISFPNLEISLNDTAQQYVDSDRTHDLSTITECTEYEQMSSEPISSEIVIASHSSTPSSERVNSEIEQRLISINDSLEQVEEIFKKVPIVPTQTTPSSESTYSTDKDFIDSNKSEESKNLLILTPPSVSSESVTSQITTSTPKVLMPDVFGEPKLERN